MNQALRNLEFWRILYLMEINIGEENFSLIVNELAKDFYHNSELRKWEYEDWKGEYIIDTVEFEFFCGDKYSLLLRLKMKYSKGFVRSENTLFLKNKFSNELFKLGWWDMAQWHPLCIKPSEFEQLHKFWFKFDRVWVGTEYPKLLLRKYIGFSDSTEVENHKKEIKRIFQKNGINLKNTKEEDLLYVNFYEKQNYKWIEEETLGWVYHSDKYNCYSIRNKPHSTNLERKFPFKEYKEMINFISKEVKEN